MLVGRRLAIGALRSAVDAAVGGAGGVVLLAGEAGMGKTALASEAVAYAKARGAAAVWGTCWEGDGAPGFWPWIQVTRALAADAGGTGEAVLAGVTGVSAERGGGLGDESAIRFRTYDLAATYLRSRAAQRPLVLVLDDLHWADVSSLRLLVFLARQLHDAAVLVIGTYRDVEVTAGDHPARPLLAELAGQAELMRLTGLAADEVGQLIEKVCGEPPQAPLIQAVHDRTAGNPFFAQQIARLLAAQGLPLDRAQVTGVPPVVGDVLARRLARLPGKVVELLAVASVGRRFPIATVAAIAGVPAETALPLLDSAVRAAVLEQDEPGHLRFSHDLFREVVYDGLSAARRPALHLSVAGRLEKHADPAATAAEIAYHRSMAWPLGDRDRAVAALVAAAHEATARTAFDEAAAHLRRAVDLVGGLTAVDLATLCEYGDALRRAGQGRDARATLLGAAARARAAGDAALFARAAFGAHRVTTVTESSRSEVIALLDEALAALEREGAADGDAARWLLSGTVQRYVREWLRGVAVAGYIGYDPATGAFTLSDEMAPVLATDDSPASMIGVFEGFVGMWNDLGTIEGFFRSGGGMSWGDHHPALNDAQARFTRPMYRAELVDGWIAALDGVTGRLQAGGQVADIGCGQGTSTITMAERFPASSFTAFDHSDAVIADAASFPVGSGQGYDLVCFTDSLHDLGDPVAAAAHARAALAPGGTVMVVEPLAADRFEDDFTNPYARVGYAISTMVCTPSSLAQPGAAALGAMAGETRIRQVLADAGYTRVRRVAAEAAPFNIVLEARP
jgi:SAM-dependent methyltransferase